MTIASTTKPSESPHEKTPGRLFRIFTSLLLRLDEHSLHTLAVVTSGIERILPDVVAVTLTALITQLKGVELYARQYYIASASGASTNVAGGGSGSNGSSQSEATNGSSASGSGSTSSGSSNNGGGSTGSASGSGSGDSGSNDGGYNFG